MKRGLKTVKKDRSLSLRAGSCLILGQLPFRGYFYVKTCFILCSEGLFSIE